MIAMRGWLIVALVAGGCVIEATECDRFKTKRSCERREADLGECVWLEVRAPIVEADGTCRADPPSHGECIGLTADTNQGCFGVECEGEHPGPAFFQHEGDRVVTFVNPHCGGSIFTGDWQSCGTGPEAPPECACACAP
jgi:hypothetical protein